MRCVKRGKWVAVFVATAMLLSGGFAAAADAVTSGNAGVSSLSAKFREADSAPTDKKSSAATAAPAGATADRKPAPSEKSPSGESASKDGASGVRIDAPASMDAAEPKAAPAAMKPAAEIKPLASGSKPAATDSKAPASDPKPAATELKIDAPSKSGDRSKAAPAASKSGESRTPVAVDGVQTERKPVGRLSPEMAQLRDRVRRVLAVHFHQPINTAENSPGEILKFCLAFGCDTEVRYGGAAGNAINGIGCLCYNYECAGQQLLTVSKRMAVARVGYGLQEQPAEWLAVLAQSAVPVDYEIKIGKGTGTVADLVEYEKASCLSGGDLSQRLIGLSFYLNDGERWKNAAGEEWSIERIVKEELARSPAKDDVDIVQQLLGLSWAVRCRARSGGAIDGQFRRAERYIAEFQDFSLSLQNADGSWHPEFFAARGAGTEASSLLRSCGRITEWLAFSLPEERLDEPRVVRGAAYLTGLLENYYASWNAAAATPRDVGNVMHALHALRTYDRRLFKAYDPPKGETPSKSETPSEKTARKPAAERTE